MRVFPNKLAKEDRDKTIDVIVGCLKEAGNSANGTSVTILMETHGDVVESALLKQIMDAVNHPKVGLVWDISNMWTITNESPSQV